MLAYGDSKTVADLYQPALATLYAGASITTLARLGTTVTQMQDTVDADLAALSLPGLKFILFNLGANTVPAMPAEAGYEADLAYILDAFHAKWPTATVYLTQTWRRGYNAESNTLATWQDNVIVGGRAAWAKVGPNERAFLENGDDGVTYTSDGVHPNAAGYALTGAKWNLSVRGY